MVGELVKHRCILCGNKRGFFSEICSRCMNELRRITITRLEEDKIILSPLKEINQIVDQVYSITGKKWKEGGESEKDV